MTEDFQQEIVKPRFCPFHHSEPMEVTPSKVIMISEFPMVLRDYKCSKGDYEETVRFDDAWTLDDLVKVTIVETVMKTDYC